MTWREAIEQACAGVPAAEAERERVLRAAHDAGIGTREMAKVIGVTHSTVWRWMGGKNAPRSAALDSDADFDLDPELRRVVAEHLSSPDESPLRGRNGDPR